MSASANVWPGSVTGWPLVAAACPRACGQRSADDQGRLIQQPWNEVSALSVGAIPHSRSSHRLQATRSEEHTSELNPLMLISYDVICLKTQHILSPPDKRL